jgi:hypothetical protein
MLGLTKVILTDFSSRYVDLLPYKLSNLS